MANLEKRGALECHNLEFVCFVRNVALHRNIDQILGLVENVDTNSGSVGAQRGRLFGQINDASGAYLGSTHSALPSAL